MPRRGDILGSFELIEKIGEGGFAQVWAGADVAGVHDLVAVKIFAPRGADPFARERFEREIRLYERLRNESGVPPEILASYEAGVGPDGVPWLALERVMGSTLARRLDGTSPVGLPLVLAVVAGLSRALAWLHSRGITHRDVSPDNVLLPDDGGIRLVDLGIAALRDEPNLTGEIGKRIGIIGKRRYVPPEAGEDEIQSMNELDFSHRDRYASGRVLSELLARLPAGWTPPLLVDLAERLVGAPEGRPTMPDVLVLVEPLLQVPTRRTHAPRARPSVSSQIVLLVDNGPAFDRPAAEGGPKVEVLERALRATLPHTPDGVGVAIVPRFGERQDARSGRVLAARLDGERLRARLADSDGFRSLRREPVPTRHCLITGYEKVAPALAQLPDLRVVYVSERPSGSPQPRLPRGTTVACSVDDLCRALLALLGGS